MSPAAQRNRGRDAAARALSVVAALGPPLHILLTVLLGLLWDAYDPIRDTQSELGAVDSPYRSEMNVAGFMGLGVSILAFAGAFAMVMRRVGWVQGVAVALLVVAGSGTLVEFYPSDTDCVDVTRTGQLHGLFSTPAAIGLPLAHLPRTHVTTSRLRRYCRL